MPSIYFLQNLSELPIASLLLRVFTFSFQTIVRLSQVSFSHATIFLPADAPTTTDTSFKACFCAPRCVNQRYYLSLLGETYAATIISCPSTLFVGYFYQFGIQFFFAPRTSITMITSSHDIAPLGGLQCHHRDHRRAWGGVYGVRCEIKLYLKCVLCDVLP